MNNKILALTICLILLCTTVNVQGQTKRTDRLMQRILGFQLPYDATAQYHLGWGVRWNSEGVDKELQTIRTNFPEFNLLRVAVTWYEMNQSTVIDSIQKFLDLCRKYDFKVLLYIMDRTGGTWPDLYPENYLEENWSDHEERIRNIMGPFKYDTQIYAWGLENEANVFQEVQVRWFEKFIPLMKSIDPDTPICTSFYPLGLNSTTATRYAEIASFGLDFIEYHHYATDFENITETVDFFTTFIKLPIFLSEFSVYEDLSKYNQATNERILREQIQEWTKRPNIIGLSYYRWSNDTDPWTIWNKTTDSMKPEGHVLNTCGPEFLNHYGYAYLYDLDSTDPATSIEIYDPSFTRLIEWSDRKGWITSHNHTQYDLKNLTTSNTKISPVQNRTVSNFDFDHDFTDWRYWPQAGDPDHFQWAIVESPTHNPYRALKLWADSTRHTDVFAEHTPITVTPGNIYFLQAWVKVESADDGAYATVSIAFRNDVGVWIEWQDCEYVNTTTDWIQVYVSGIAPAGAADMVILMRARAWDAPGQSVVAYYDYVTLQETTPASYDGGSYALAWGRGAYDLYYNFAQVAQNYTFQNPDEDVMKMWTYKARMATVQSTEYWTDWKGCYLTLAFTTDDPDEWITWYDSKYLSSNHDFTELTVSAIPPPNAKGLMMIVKVSIGNYGVMFFDDARLYAKPIVIPQNFTISPITEPLSQYTLDMHIRALNNTAFRGSFNGNPLEIISSNVHYARSDFTAQMNDTVKHLHFIFGVGPSEARLPIMFYVGMLGLAIWFLTAWWVVRSIKRRNYGNLVWAITLLIIGTGCVIIWLGG